MDPVKPKQPTNPDWEFATYAENQPEYQPLPSMRNTHRPEVPVISAWQLTEEEVAYIVQCEAAGVPAVLYHEQWTFNEDRQVASDPLIPNPLQPIRMWFGEPAPVEGRGGPWDPDKPSMGDLDRIANGR